MRFCNLQQKEVIKNVNAGKININRYTRYKDLFSQSKEKWQNLYMPIMRQQQK